MSRAPWLRPEVGGRNPVPSASWPFSEKDTEAGPRRQNCRSLPCHLTTAAQQTQRTQGTKLAGGWGAEAVPQRD